MKIRQITITVPEGVQRFLIKEAQKNIVSVAAIARYFMAEGIGKDKFFRLAEDGIKTKSNG